MSKYKLAVVGIMSVIVLAFASATFFATTKMPKPKTTTKTTPAIKKPTPQITYGAPLSLAIPKINVTAKTIPVGLTSHGDMDVPSNIVDVGWYKYGTNPGNSGTAVLDGHLDSASGQPGVFFNLKELVKGDHLIVSDGQNKATFTVDHITAYNQLAHPEEVFDSGSGTHLNLITCTGSWDQISGRYKQRLVVFTNLSH